MRDDSHLYGVNYNHMASGWTQQIIFVWQIQQSGGIDTLPLRGADLNND